MFHHPTHRTCLGAALATLVVLVAGLVVALVLALPPGRTPGEVQFLAAERATSPLVELDEESALNNGWDVCETVASFKPQRRSDAADDLFLVGVVSGERLDNIRTYLCPAVFEQQF